MVNIILYVIKEIDTITFQVPCLVVPQLKRPLILGYDWILENNVTLGRTLKLVKENIEHEIHVTSELASDSLVIEETAIHLQTKVVVKERIVYNKIEIREVVNRADLNDEKLRTNFFVC